MNELRFESPKYKRVKTLKATLYAFIALVNVLAAIAIFAGHGWWLVAICNIVVASQFAMFALRTVRL